MKKEKKITVRFTVKDYEKIEKVAKKLNEPVSEIVRNLTLIGLDDVAIYEALGLFEIVKMIKKLNEKALNFKTNLKNNQPALN